MGTKRIASIILIIFLSFYVLHIGKFFFVPFAIAIVVWYSLIALADAYRNFAQKRLNFNRFPAMSLAILSLSSLLAVLIWLLNRNIDRIIKLLPLYEAKMRQLVYDILNGIGVDTSHGLRQILDSFDTTPLLLEATRLLTTGAGYLVMVIVYTTFLLLEYRRFGKKIKLIINDNENYGRFYRTMKNIDGDMRTYLKIKSIANLIIAAASFLLMLFVGVDLALFWAIMIFVLNYIPTIGPIIAVSMPALLSLIQFDTAIPFIFIVSALSLLHIGVGTILEPRYLGHSLNLSPLVIIISLALWGSIWGVVGMFLSVPIMVVVNIILARFERTRPIAILLSARGKIL